jgi:putative transposase
VKPNKVVRRSQWLLWMMQKAGEKNKRNGNFQFWQQHNHPIQLDTIEMINQRLEYIHNNPVEQGFVQKAEEWNDSSCAAYYGTGNSEIELIYLE